MATIELGTDGRIVLPDEAIRALHVAVPSRLEWHVENGTLVLSPAGAGSDEDAWAYTPEHLAAVQRSAEDSEAGRVYAGVGERFLLALAEKAEALHRDGRELNREELTRTLEAAVATGEIKRASADAQH